MATNKVVVNNQTLIDLTGDTVTAASLASGITAHGADGSIITGTNTKDSNTQDATALASEILSSKTAYVKGAKITGSMSNRGSASGTISTKAGTYSIQQGYHDGNGSVSISSAEQDKIIAGNIKSGVSILGVTGTYTGTNTSGDTVTAASLVKGYTAHNSAGTSITGTAPYIIFSGTGYEAIQGTSYAATPCAITVPLAGTYNISWNAYIVSTGSQGTELYINGSLYGSAYTSFVSEHSFVEISNVSLAANSSLVVWAKSGSKSAKVYVGYLIAEKV